MPRIKIVPNETLSLASSLDSKASQLSSISSSASSIVTGLSYNVRSKAGIQSKMGQARSLASNISGQIASLSGYVKTATNMFVEADKTNSIALSKVSSKYISLYKGLPAISSQLKKNSLLFGVVAITGAVALKTGLKGTEGKNVTLQNIAPSYSYDGSEADVIMWRQANRNKTPEQLVEAQLDYVNKYINKKSPNLEKIKSRAIFKEIDKWIPNYIDNDSSISFDKLKSKYTIESILYFSIRGDKEKEADENLKTNADWLAGHVSPYLFEKAGELKALDLATTEIYKNGIFAFNGPYLRRAAYNDDTKQLEWHISKPTSFIHEYSHHLASEKTNSSLYDMSKAFFNRQTVGLQSTVIYENKPGPGDDEIGIKDSFYDIYSGKIYDGEGGKEILSQGILQMHDNPIDFYNTAPEQFKFTLGVMMGLCP